MNTGGTTYERMMQDPKRCERMKEEEFVLDITEKICEIMESKNISKAELARKMGVSRALISQFLNGERNLTLRSLFKISREIGFDIHLMSKKPMHHFNVIHCDFMKIPKVHYSNEVHDKDKEPHRVRRAVG